MKKKGFTLIELLAVIVILGVIMVIAVPAVTRYINQSRQDSFISTAKSYVDAVQTASVTNGSDSYQVPSDGNAVVVKLTSIKLNKGGTSPYGGDFVDDYSYIIIYNKSDKVVYYFQAVDAKGNYINCLADNIDADKLTRANVKAAASTADTGIPAATGDTITLTMNDESEVTASVY